MKKQIETISSWLGSGSINIFGHPFSGKDTQGEKLAELLNGVLMGGGDILRNYHDQDMIKKMMSTGDLFPTDLYLKIVLPYLSKSEFENRPLILSALGRMKGEETTIVEAAKSSGHPIKAVLLLDLTEEEVWRRFEESKKQQDRGERQDDKKEALVNRLEKFRVETIPVIEYYRDQGLLIEIDGTLDKNEVTKEILEKLEIKATS